MMCHIFRVADRGATADLARIPHDGEPAANRDAPPTAAGLRAVAVGLRRIGRAFGTRAAADQRARRGPWVGAEPAVASVAADAWSRSGATPRQRRRPPWRDRRAHRRRAGRAGHRGTWTRRARAFRGVRRVERRAAAGVRLGDRVGGGAAYQSASVNLMTPRMFLPSSMSAYPSLMCSNE